jgi:ParB family chromosome partitioning protein
MSAGKPRQSLGRGLNALFSDTAEDAPVAMTSSAEAAPATPPVPAGKGLTLLPVEHLHPSPLQPRRVFNETQIGELAASIRDKGVLQPLLVRAAADGRYEIIAGERRWRAAQQAQVHQVPVLVREFSDVEVLEVALVENLQRADLTPIEEAEGYARLLEEFGHTQEALGELLGKSRTHIANMIRLLGLPDTVKSLLDAGTLTIGHARALIGVSDAASLAKDIVKKGLSVRQVEKLVRKHGKPQRKRAAAEPGGVGHGKDADTRVLEHQLEEVLGLKVDISFDGTGGVLSLAYQSLEQLDDVVARLTQRKPPEKPAASAAKDPNVLDIEEVLAKRAGAFPKGHSEDPADAAVHPDTRQGDVGASGSTERPKPDDPGLEGSGAFPRDHGGDAVTKDAHPDPREHDIGASGSTSRE